MAYNQLLNPGQDAHAVNAILASLPGHHGTHSNPRRNVRRRLNKKWNAEAKAAAAAGAATPSTSSSIDPSISASVACGDPGYPLYNIPCQREPPFLPDVPRDITVYAAHIDQGQFPRKPPSGIPPSPDQDHAPEQSRGERHATAPRRDSRENKRPRNPPSPPQNKPALAANSTSAEIVEALMPDRPAPVRLPRRTASVRYSEERKIALKISISAEFGKRRA